MRRRRRQHEIDRELQEREERDAAERKRFWHNVMVVKASVMLFFVLSWLLPPQHAVWANAAGNLLWLWRT
jgi:Flp pilus assembly protein TadB